MYNSITCNEKWKANVEDQMAVDAGSPPRLSVQRKKLKNPAGKAGSARDVRWDEHI